MLSCNIVKDLLPSYLEHLTRPETNAEIEAHLEACDGCRSVRDSMAAEVKIEKAPNPKTDFFKKLRHKQIIGALLSAVITLLCLYGLYNMAFSVDVTNTATLEAAIDEYFFTENVDADIIESNRIGNQLLVFFERKGYTGNYGLAYLEPGILGKYRFRSASLSDWPLYDYTAKSSGGKNYLIFCGVNDLPGVASYAVYPKDDTSAQPIYHGDLEAAPFLRVIETGENEPYLGVQFVHYYDENGNEVNFNQLWHEAPEPAEGATPGVGTAEAGLIYIYMGIVLLLGIVFVRYFLKA
ncbi:MAG: zf-HC2 domain-containing protein [Oscillospiraceae bacterium]